MYKTYHILKIVTFASDNGKKCKILVYIQFSLNVKDNKNCLETNLTFIRNIFVKITTQQNM
jgi:hypothetical protein